MDGSTNNAQHNAELVTAYDYLLNFPPASQPLATHRNNFEKTMKKERKTPYDYSSPVNLSDATTRSAGRKFASDKNWGGPTSPTHSKPTSADEALDAIPGATKSHPSLSAKQEMRGGMNGDGKKMMAPKSGELTLSPDAAHSVPRRWHKRGFSMETPSTVSGRLAKKWEL